MLNALEDDVEVGELSVPAAYRPPALACRAHSFDESHSFGAGKTDDQVAASDIGRGQARPC